MSTKCPQCGTENQDNAKFCNECGYKFPQQNVCPSCGLPVQPGIKFCSNCGHSFVAKTVPQPVHTAGASSCSCNAPSAYAGSSCSTAASYSAICIDCSCTATVSCLATNACGAYSATAPCSPSYSGDSYAVFPCPAGTTDSTETRVSEIA